MKIKKMCLAALVLVLPLLADAQIKTNTQPISTQPNVKPDFTVNPRLVTGTSASFKLSGNSTKHWLLTALTTITAAKSYPRDVAGTCYADNELIFNKDQTAAFSEGSQVCSFSTAVNNLTWQLSSDNKKLSLSGIPAIVKANALIGFLLAPDSEIIELTDTTLKLRFKAWDGATNPDGSPKYVTNEVTYTAK